MIFAVLLICSQFGLLGLPSAVSYYTSSCAVPAGRLVFSVRGAVVVQSAVSAGLAVLILVSMSALGHDFAQTALQATLIGAGVVVVMAALLAQSGLQGEQRFHVYSRLLPVPVIVYVAGLTMLLLSGSGSVALVLASLLGGWLLQSVVAWALLIGSARRASVPVEPAPEPTAVRAFGRRAAVASAAPVDQLTVDQLLVGLLLGHQALGLYVIGAAFMSVTLLPLAALGTFVGPRIASVEAASQRRQAGRWLLAGATLGTLTCVAVVVAVPVLTPIAFGSEATSAVPAGRLLAIAGLLLGQRRLNSAVLQALGSPGRSTAAETISFITLVAGVLLLSTTNGVLGACFAVIVAGLVSNLIQMHTLLTRTGTRGVTATRWTIKG